MLRDQILSVLDMRTEPVEVPEWGGTVHVRTFTGGERAKLLKLWKDAEKSGTEADLNVHLVITGACEASGARLFTEDDFPALADKAATAIDRIATAVLKVNGLAGESVDAAKN